MRAITYPAIVLLAALLAGPAPAQSGQEGTAPASPGPPGEAGPETPLFANPDVVRALGLTQNQVNSLRDTVARLRQDLQAQLDRIEDLRGAERTRRLREINDQYNTRWHKAAAGVLTPKQMARYRQLELQARGPEAFADTRVQKQLKLTDQQRQKLQALRKRYERQLSELRKPARGPDEAARRVAAYRKQFFQEANAILDAAQRRRWRELIGEDFNLKPNVAS